MNEDDMKKGYLYILISTVLFSTMEIMLKLTAGGFRPLQITLLRFTIFRKAICCIGP